MAGEAKEEWGRDWSWNGVGGAMGEGEDIQDGRCPPPFPNPLHIFPSPKWTPLPTLPEIKHAARSLCCDNILSNNSNSVAMELALTIQKQTNRNHVFMIWIKFQAKQNGIK